LSGGFCPVNMSFRRFPLLRRPRQIPLRQDPALGFAEMPILRSGRSPPAPSTSSGCGKTGALRLGLCKAPPFSIGSKADAGSPAADRAIACGEFPLSASPRQSSGSASPRVAGQKRVGRARRPFLALALSLSKGRGKRCRGEETEKERMGCNSHVQSPCRRGGESAFDIPAGAKRKLGVWKAQGACSCMRPRASVRGGGDADALANVRRNAPPQGGPRCS